MSGFRHPTAERRVAVIGRNGSGKTQFGAFLLSRAPFHTQPYVIVNFKADAFLNSIPYVDEIGYTDHPSKPGVYMLQHRPGNDAAMEAWMWKVWERERTGIFFDEMYGIPDPLKGGALRSIFTQGRSKKIPVIGCTQRPKHISRFLFSEADFFALFHLSTKPDRDALRDFYESTNVNRRLPPFHCEWYDVAADYGTVLKPCPPADATLQWFEDRLRPRVRSF